MHRMRFFAPAALAMALVMLPASAQTPPAAGVAPNAGFAGPRDPVAGKRKVLFVADLATGVPTAHDWSASRAAAVLQQLGRDSGAYELYIQTTTDLVKKAEAASAAPADPAARRSRGRNLDYFDAVVFFTNGDTGMDDRQVKDLLSFVADDGKGFVGIHTATVTLTRHPKYGAMIGAFFDNHPWGVTTAPVIVEDRDNPAMAKFLPGQTVTDEFYQMKAPYDRANLRVLARLDVSHLDLKNPNVHRGDGDFPIAWVRNHGKGRVFYSALGHTVDSWDDYRVRDMYLQGIRFALGDVEMNTTPQPLPAAEK